MYVILCLIDHSLSTVDKAYLCIEMCRQLVPNHLYFQQQQVRQNELQACFIFNFNDRSKKSTTEIFLLINKNTEDD